MTKQFEPWFIAQHGPRASKGTEHNADDDLRRVIQAGRIAADELARRELWDEKETSALYAWQANYG